MVNVTQLDLHDLLETFEKKSFEAVAFEEGTTVSEKPVIQPPACNIKKPVGGARARVVTFPLTVFNFAKRNM